MGPISIRNEIRTGDVERIIRLHVDLFGREHGLDATFADHIRGPLTAFIDRRSPRDGKARHRATAGHVIR